MVVALYVEVERLDDKRKFPAEIIGQLFDMPKSSFNTTI